MAGLLGEFAGKQRFVILTAPANGSMVPVHNRMPVVLTRPEIGQWMGSFRGALDVLQSDRPERIKRLAYIESLLSSGPV